MVMVRSWGLSILCWTLCCISADRIIEIVEEQKCHDHLFRLTCRDLQTHIAILEAWYTTLDDYRNNPQTEPESHVKITRSHIDEELDRVYTYSSPKHDGYYVPVKAKHKNKSLVLNNNISLLNKGDVVDSGLNDSFVDVVEMLRDGDDEGCGVMTFSRSYSSAKNGFKKQIAVVRGTSINIRAPLTYRCTGVNHCSFSLADDYPPSRSWMPGAVFLKYACFDDLQSIHYCNREVLIGSTGAESEGYIRTPGYPHFYIGEECRWRLQVHPEQRIRLTVLDVSLRSIQMPYEKECVDYILIEDASGERLFSSCDQVDTPVRLMSETNVLDIAVETGSMGAFPKRGVLLHYKSTGCVTLPAPSNGYMVYRNAERAHYVCDVNYVFVDTRQRSRIVWCYEDNKWNDSVPYCEETSEGEVSNDNWFPEKDPPTKLPHEPNMIVDIVIPSLLIAALFVGNAFIVFVIYKYRKRKNEDIEDEFNTIPLNGSGHTAGNAV